ncbi:MAG: hypothetical protein ABFD91_17625 [Anaerohalosphaeraceae bacterium]
MIRKTLWMAVLVLAIAALNGCKKQTPSPAPAQPAEPAKTVQEVKTEADKEITSENLDAELDKMEKEVDADIATEQ